METMDESTHKKFQGRLFVRVTALLQRTGHSDFSGIPNKDFYMAQGSEKHLMFEHIEKGVDHEYNYDPRVEAFRPAHANFIRDTGFQAIRGGIEKPVRATWKELGFNPGHNVEEAGICGTLDRLGNIQGHLALIDFKGSTIPKSTPAQTALYLMLWLLKSPGHHTFRSVSRFGVAFKADGVLGKIGSGYSMSQAYPHSDKHLALDLISQYLKEKP